jgi:hypothetical protein
LRGKMTTSPCSLRSTRGSPSASRHVKGGNVISFSPGYCRPYPHTHPAQHPAARQRDYTLGFKFVVKSKGK